MSMSKKDFIALADAIREANRVARAGTAEGSAERTRTYYVSGGFGEDHLNTLASFCRSQNPAFMRGRWLSYIAGECGPGGGAVKS